MRILVQSRKYLSYKAKSISRTKQKVFLIQRKKYLREMQLQELPAQLSGFQYFFTSSIHIYNPWFRNSKLALRRISFIFLVLLHFDVKLDCGKDPQNSLFNKTLSRTFLMTDIISLLIIRSHTTLVVANFVIKFKRVDYLVPLSQTMA